MTKEEELIHNLYNKALVELFDGKSEKFIISSYIKLGISEEVAQKVVHIANMHKKKEYRKAGFETIGIGIFFLVLGAIITGVTYSAASSGGSYVVTTGLFLVGGWMILKGLWKIIFS